jgi:hypothetical protein
MLTPGPEDQRSRITIEEAEAEDAAERIRSVRREENHSRHEQLRKPFGYCNAQWKELKGMMQPEDELWEVCTSKEVVGRIDGFPPY